MQRTVGVVLRFTCAVLLAGPLDAGLAAADDDVPAPPLVAGLAEPAGNLEVDQKGADANGGDAKGDVAPNDAPGDVTGLSLIVQSVEHLRANKYLLRASVENAGDVDAEGPLRVVISGSTEPGFELTRDDGRTEADEPYIEFVGKRRSLERGTASRARAIQFRLEAEDIGDEQLAKLDFEYTILGPGVRGEGLRKTRGRRDAKDDPDAEDDRDGEERGATDDRSEDARSRTDSRRATSGRRTNSRGPNGAGGGGGGLGDDVFATARSVVNGESVVVAYVASREAARRLPRRAGGARVVARLSFPLNLYGAEAPRGGDVDVGLVGRRVIGRRGDGSPPRVGVVTAVGLSGSLRANGASRRVAGLTVVEGAGGSFASAGDIGMSVEDETGKPLGVVVGGNSALTLLAAGGEGGRQRRVLFVGNSYTMNNDLPALVAKVAQAAGHTLEVECSLEGGATLRRHLQKGDAVAKVQQSKFDVVMLQEQSLTPILNRDGMWAAATELDAVIREAGAKTMFFMTWARRGKPEMTKGLADSYGGIAKRLGANVAPVGHAWHDVVENAGIGLHTEDGSHPTATGSLLAAFVMYATLFDEDPRKVPGSFGLPAAQATVLKAAAAKAVRR